VFCEKSDTDGKPRMQFYMLLPYGREDLWFIINGGRADERWVGDSDVGQLKIQDKKMTDLTASITLNTSRKYYWSALPATDKLAYWYTVKMLRRYDTIRYGKLTCAQKPMRWHSCLLAAESTFKCHDNLNADRWRPTSTQQKYLEKYQHF